MILDLLPWENTDTTHALRRAYGRLGSTLDVARAQWKALAWVEREPGLRQVILADRLDIEPITLRTNLARIRDKVGVLDGAGKVSA